MGNIFFLSFIFLATPQFHSLEETDIHGVQKLLLTIHTLEVDVGILRVCMVVLLILFSLLIDSLRFLLQLPDRLLSLLNVFLSFSFGFFIQACLTL